MINTKFMGSSSKFNRLNRTETIGYLFLKNKGIQIKKFGSKDGSTDFTAKYGKRYEIKRLFLGKGNAQYIKFTNWQVKRFKDSNVILVFEPFKYEPKVILLFKKIKHKISQTGILSLSKIQKGGRSLV